MIRATLVSIAFVSGVLAFAPAFIPPAAQTAPAAYRLPAAVIDRILAARLVDLAPAARLDNWDGPRGQGSCMWASLANLLQWQGRADLGRQIRAQRGDGASNWDLTQHLDRCGIDWAYGEDPAFLEWACRTRRGAVIPWWNGSHAVCLVGFDEAHAWVLDNTGEYGRQIVRYRRADFLAHWLASGGNAITPLAGPPGPPRPWIITEKSE